MNKNKDGTGQHEAKMVNDLQVSQQNMAPQSTTNTVNSSETQAFHLSDDKIAL